MGKKTNFLLLMHKVLQMIVIRIAGNDFTLLGLDIKNNTKTLCTCGKGEFVCFPSKGSF